METSASPLMLFAVIAVGIIAGAQLVTIIAAVTPTSASETELWVFFISLFVALATSFTLMWYGMQKVQAKRRVHNPRFTRCMRQATLVAALITFTLFLNSINVFQIWDIFPLIVAGVLIEFFFQAEKRPHASLRHNATPEAE
ncbi:hypothetical protein BH11PAT4_BH11PAT4_7380 [soil metagenome]